MSHPSEKKPQRMWPKSLFFLSGIFREYRLMADMCQKSLTVCTNVNNCGGSMTVVLSSPSAEREKCAPSRQELRTVRERFSFLGRPRFFGPALATIRHFAT